MICNVTLDSSDWGEVEPRLKNFLASLPSQAFNPVLWQPEYITHNEGLIIPAQVNYVGKGANLFDLGYNLHGSAQIISKYLGTTWLWNQVRVLGGAYGGFAIFDAASGVFRFVSYRDPNLIQTLDIYDQTADFLKNLEMDEAELTKAIIGTIGQLDGYQLPDAKGYSSMLRYLIGNTDELRQQTRDEILSTTVGDIRQFGDVINTMKTAGHVVVIGSQGAIEAANAARAGLLNPLKVL
jgi:Zn-dependent M16 (insulinase) family peptidase